VLTTEVSCWSAAMAAAPIRHTLPGGHRSLATTVTGRRSPHRSHLQPVQIEPCLGCEAAGEDPIIGQVRGRGRAGDVLVLFSVCPLTGPRQRRRGCQGGDRRRHVSLGHDRPRAKHGHQPCAEAVTVAATNTRAIEEVHLAAVHIFAQRSSRRSETMPELPGAGWPRQPAAHPSGDRRLAAAACVVRGGLRRSLDGLAHQCSRGCDGDVQAGLLAGHPLENRACVAAFPAAFPLGPGRP
jgi:hypothetical protein